MSQDHQDKFADEKQFFQNVDGENESRCEDKLSMKNETIAEELLSIEKLADISGGINQEPNYSSYQEVKSHPSESKTDPSKLSPTFPISPRLEDSL